jgi:ABC-2 type transport system permease protein
MHEAAVLIRAGWQTALSYRLRMVLSLVALVAAVVPVYFIAGAIQPLIADAIRTEGSHYFAFLLVGMVTMQFLTSALNTLPGAIGSGIGSGMLEAVLSTRARLPAVLVGMVGYDLMWTAVRAAILLMAGVALGARFQWAHVPLALGILVMIVLLYFAIGLVSAALVLAFRTPGPISTAVLTLSAFLGGVYYPTTVIPSWIQDISTFIPLTYGLRAMRQTVLEGYPLRLVLPDVLILAASTLVLLAIGYAVFLRALRYARTAGTLSHY